MTEDALSLTIDGPKDQRQNEARNSRGRRMIDSAKNLSGKCGRALQHGLAWVTTARRRDNINALSTFVMAVATAAIFVAAIGQWRAMGGQLTVMQRQLDEMKATGQQTDILIETNKRLAEAAGRSANVAERALKTTQRAYFTVTPKLAGFERGGHPQATILVRNVGITPAYAVTMKAFIGVVLYPFPDDVTLTDQVSGEVAAATVVKDEAMRIDVTLSQTMPDEHFEQIEKALSIRLIVWAFLDFNDAFGCKIRRTVCFLYAGESARKGDDPGLCGGGRNDEKYLDECRP